MTIFDTFERLITEHGSAAILREHLALLKAKQLALESGNSDLHRENKGLKAENVDLRNRLGELERNLDEINNVSRFRYVCDHCGSPKLKRIGNIADPFFGKLGEKQSLFSCEICGKESAFSQNP
jgi:hypothetical protein